MTEGPATVHEGPATGHGRRTLPALFIEKGRKGFRAFGRGSGSQRDPIWDSRVNLQA